MLLQVVLVLCLASLSASLPTTYTSDQVVIVNGTSVTVGFMDSAFVYCKAQVTTTDDLHHYRVQWRDPAGVVVPRWSRNAYFPFSLESNSHLLQSYLVFKTFLGVFADDYTCELVKNNIEVRSSATVAVVLDT